MPNEKGQPADQIPYAITISDPESYLTWRCQPGPATTLGELDLACKAFELKVWVSPTLEVMLVSQLNRTLPLPDSADLVRVMWGLCAVKTREVKS